MGSGAGGGTTVTKQELSPEQQELLSLVIPRAREYMQNPLQMYPGSAIPGFNPYQLQAQQMALGAVPGMQDLAGAAAGTQNFLAGDVLRPETNPYMEQYAQAAIRPIEQQFSQTVLPGIRGDAIAAGGFGGSRQGVAEGIATQSFLQQIGDTSANVYNQGYAQGLDAMTRGLLLAPQTQAMQLAPADVYGAVGAQEYSLAAARAQEEAQKFMTEQYLPFLQAQQVAGLATGIPGGTVTSTGSMSGGGIHPMLGALGGGFMGMSLLGPAGFALTGAPWGFAIGAGLGLLGSFF